MVYVSSTIWTKFANFCSKAECTNLCIQTAVSFFALYRKKKRVNLNTEPGIRSIAETPWNMQLQPHARRKVLQHANPIVKIRWRSSLYG